MSGVEALKRVCHLMYRWFPLSLMGAFVAHAEGGRSVVLLGAWLG